MAISIDQLRRALGSDEPEYDRLRRLGPGLVPQLLRLVRDRDEYVAANAASLAGMIGGGQALSVLQQAGRSRSATVRVAVAGALRHIRTPAAAGIATSLLADRNAGVRKFAMKAANRANPTVAAKLAAMQKSDPSPANRVLAAQLLGRSRLA